MKPTKLNYNNKKVKNKRISLSQGNKKIWAYQIFRVERESRMAFWGMKVMLLCMNGSVLQQERSLSSTADVWQYRS